MSLSEENNKVALSVLKQIGSATDTKWKAETGLSFGAFAGAKKRLLESGVVVEVEDEFGEKIYNFNGVVPLSEQSEVIPSSEQSEVIPLLEQSEVIPLSEQSEVEIEKGGVVKVVSEVRTIAKNPNSGKGKLPVVSDKIVGWFNDFDDWQANVIDNYGDGIEFNELGGNRVRVILDDGRIHNYRYREDDDGGLIFR